MRASPAFRPRQIGPEAGWSQLSRTITISTYAANKRMGKTARATAGKAAFIKRHAMATTRYR